ncbi:MAG TPA: circadian clock protein KaiC, partial [Nitrospirota bacterium]
MDQKPKRVEKLSLGIQGFDEISYGGLPKERMTIVSGTVGSGKTVFSTQFLADGIMRAGENGVFVTFEESPDEIRRNIASFGWDIGAWEAEGKWVFVDASPQPEETVITGTYNLSALLARIEHAIGKVNAKRIAMDSLGAIMAQLGDQVLVRRELLRVIAMFRSKNVTAVITTERSEEYSSIAHYGIEEFVADNVILLRNISEEETRRRTIEILKFRGTTHQKREFPFGIIPDEGIVIIPFSTTPLTQKVSSHRITTGNGKLDAMCGGGIFSDALTLVSGPSGTGKTLITSQFMSANSNKEDRALFFAYEESRDLLFRNAKAWGVDFEAAEKEGNLRVVCRYPEEVTMEDHLIAIKNAVNEFKPTKIALDSLSALERISSVRSYRIFVVGLTSFLKEKRIAALFTNTSDTLLGGVTISEARISTLADNIVLLRYAE